MNISRMLRSLLPRELHVPQNPGKRVLASLGYFRFRTRIAAEGASVPDLDLYRPLFSPWEGLPDFRTHFEAIREHTLVSADRCWILSSCLSHARNLEGDFAEFGVFRGGTALLAARVLSDARDGRCLHLFDSFAGMPKTSDGEPYRAGDLDQTSAAHVERLVGSTGAKVKLHVGYIPETFRETGIDRLAFAHIDVDLYKSVLDCVEFVYPRLVPGGMIIFDDYGFPGCVRAREATDKAFESLPEKPIYLPTGQAVVIKLATVPTATP
jgi:O-methyltransferase